MMSGLFAVDAQTGCLESSDGLTRHSMKRVPARNDSTINIRAIGIFHDIPRDLPLPAVASLVVLGRRDWQDSERLPEPSLLQQAVNE
jgi:hypothetical protein